MRMENKVQENNALFASLDAVVDGDDLWLLSVDMDVLLHFDFRSLKLLDYHIIPVEKWIPYAHVRLRKCGHNVYIVPYAENSMFFYDCVSREMGKIEFPYQNGESKKRSKFNMVVVWKSCLVIVGRDIRGIFYFDTISERFTKDIGYLVELEKVGCEGSALLFNDCYYQKENKLYIPVLKKNLILEIDLEKRTNKIYELKQEKGIRLRTIDIYEQDGKEKFLLTTVDDEMLIWSPGDGIEKKRALGLLYGEYKAYARAFHVGTKNYYIASHERKVFVEEKDRIRELEFEYERRGGFNEAVGDIQGYSQFNAVFRNGTDIYFQARSNGQLFKINTKIDKIQRVDFDVSLEKREEIIGQVCRSRQTVDVFMENLGFGLEYFLKKYICREDEQLYVNRGN